MSAEDELREVEDELSRYRNTGTPPKDTLRTYMRLSREARVRNADGVALYGAQLLKHYKGALSEEELWLLHEQVAVAALECGATQTALGLVKAVLSKFPDSIRAKRLQGMYYEATGKEDLAEEVYTDIIKEKPQSEVIAKRLVALSKTRGNLPAAIDHLRTYLDHYMNDREGWEELAELYTEVGMYRQAAFCWEELITMAPTHPAFLVRYADTLYTLGGQANVRTARAYYSRALTASAGRSVRALYGLVACGASDKDSSTAVQALPSAAADTLLQLYAEQAPDKLPIVREAFGRKQQSLPPP